MNKKLFNFNFRNKHVTFHKLVLFAKRTNLDPKECLIQAFNQNALIDDNIDFLKRFIDYFEKIENFQSQIYQDIFASFIVGDKYDKTFLEFGATNGLDISNSYTLESSFNWKGVLSEPSPQWHEALKKNRKNSKIITKCIWKETGKKLDFFMSDFGSLSTIKDFVENDKISIPTNTEMRLKSGKTISVETISLNDVIKEYFNSICPSYISIDTEGSEYEILKAFDLDNFRPKVFTIEHNHTENETKIDEHLITNGYVRIFRKLTTFDAWYIPSEILKSTS
ncbi:FkbM family methyltransferase [Candidatus Pelagibacter sp.]|nr:FkbM family methyltransferase [Candidatus Pelagibacter sp.]